MNVMKNGQMHDAPYKAIPVYFGTNKSSLYAKFFKAVERAQQLPLAFSVNVWEDSTGIVLHVEIEHNPEKWF